MLEILGGKTWRHYEGVMCSKIINELNNDYQEKMVEVETFVLQLKYLLCCTPFVDFYIFSLL